MLTSALDPSLLEQLGIYRFLPKVSQLTGSFPKLSVSLGRESVMRVTADLGCFGLDIYWNFGLLVLPLVLCRQ